MAVGKLLSFLKNHTAEMHRQKRQRGRKKVIILCILYFIAPLREGVIIISILQTKVLI